VEKVVSRDSADSSLPRSEVAAGFVDIAVGVERVVSRDSADSSLPRSEVAAGFVDIAVGVEKVVSRDSADSIDVGVALVAVQEAVVAVAVAVGRLVDVLYDRCCG
jgi:hypothetical protein